MAVRLFLGALLGVSACAQTASAVSYSSQIAPIFAFHCNSCHGDMGVASGFATNSYAALLRGGNQGDDVTPGEPERSGLVHYIEGRRGEEHRMPLGAEPLPPREIDLIRRWIVEGAKEDRDTTPKYSLATERFRIRPSESVKIFCRPVVRSYLTLTIVDPKNGRVLYQQKAAVDRSSADGIAWMVRPEKTWPKWVRAELTIQYAEGNPAVMRLEVNAK